MNNADSDIIAEKVAQRVKPTNPTPENVRRKNLNPATTNPVELQASILVPQTGKARIGNDLDQVYKVPFLNDDGSESYVDVWDLFSSVTSDTRIANLDPNKPEYAYVQWAMDLWIKSIQNGYVGAAACAQGMALSVTEPSLAKGMAFLKNIQTVRQESSHVQVEENKTKRSIFGIPIGGQR